MESGRALRGLALNVALDTNILVYAEGLNGQQMQSVALRTLSAIRKNGSLVIPVQALGELFAVLRRRAGYKAAEARRAILDWRSSAKTIDTTSLILVDAADLAQNQFSIWDAVVVCAAAEAGCQLLLSEDMQDGFIWKGMTIVNPFANSIHPLLQSVLGPQT